MSFYLDSHRLAVRDKLAVFVPSLSCAELVSFCFVRRNMEDRVGDIYQSANAGGADFLSSYGWALQEFCANSVLFAES